MEKSGEELKSTGVRVRIYDLFGKIDALWVCGYAMERKRTEYFYYYEFFADRELPLAIHVANSCKNPLVSAMVESGGGAEVCIRDGAWGAVTPDVPFNMVGFLFRAREGSVGTIGVSVAVREDMSANNYKC